MENIDSGVKATDSGHVGLHVGVENATECLNKCNSNKECSLWTFIGGQCYLKNLNTFEGQKDNAFSGMKICNENSTYQFT